MRLLKALALCAAFLFAVAGVRAATSVTQYGITWTFDADYTVGQYATGDYYVVAPSGLNITSISPASVLVASRVNDYSTPNPYLNSYINGSMKTPIVASNTSQQGFDSAAPAYNASLNAARPGGNDLSVSNPMVVSTNSSIISTISKSHVDRPALSTAAVLTVVDAAPAAGSDAMRPPYCGTDKVSHWKKSDLNYSILRTFAPVASTPSLSGSEADFQRPWIEVITEQNGWWTHPTSNQPGYGFDMTNDAISPALLQLLLNYTNSQKETLYMRICQYGIDIYGAATTGGRWSSNGGHNLGRKMPMLLAGLAFNDSNILAYADNATHNIFQEDFQTFVIDAAVQARTPYIGDNRQRNNYQDRNQTVTLTAGSPGRINYTNHGMAPSQPFTLSVSGGSLPPEVNTTQEYLTLSETFPVTSVFANQWVEIATEGTTNWAAMGLSSDPSPGDFFKATGPGTGTGTVKALPQNDFKFTSRGTTVNLSSSGTGTITFIANTIGLPEWGEKHNSDPTRDGANNNAYYRDKNGPALMGSFLVGIMVTGAKTAWNHDAYFDYMDRFWLRSSLTGVFKTFTTNMMSTYRNAGAPPAAPTSPTAAGTSSSIIRFQWTDASSGTASFVVERSAHGANTFAQIGTTPIGDTDYDDPGLPVSTTFDYRVYATNAGGNSAYSATAEGTTLGPPSSVDSNSAPSRGNVGIIGGL